MITIAAILYHEVKGSRQLFENAKEMVARTECHNHDNSLPPPLKKLDYERSVFLPKVLRASGKVKIKKMRLLAFI